MEEWNIFVSSLDSLDLCKYQTNMMATLLAWGRYLGRELAKMAEVKEAVELSGVILCLHYFGPRPESITNTVSQSLAPSSMPQM